ncbi:MAG: prolyl-tRNA synthetase associated domain-containing protein [Flavobacteriales bacterium]|nr:prolyl-tRNA synthetase associated domain-containing protein [Flavobacteriales bacterium]
MSDRKKTVYSYLDSKGIEYECYDHPAAPTIEIAKEYLKEDGSMHCKNLFFRNKKGNRHYLVLLDGDQSMAIHDMEARPHQGKLTFASPERMERYLGLSPGSVSPFGLINDAEHHVHVFIDRNIENASSLSFHPNDNTATVVISLSQFLKYMECVGNSYEFIELY